MTLIDDANLMDKLIERENNAQSRGVREAATAALRRLIKRNPAAYDSILFPGAARLFLQGGNKAVRDEFTRRYQQGSPTHTDKQAGVVYKGGLARLGKQADERFMSEDDAERLAAKAEALKMPTWAHDVLMMNVGTTVLERVYDDSLGSAGKSRKDLDRITQRAMLTQKLIKAGVPETVLGQLAIKLGDQTGVFAALAAHVGTMKMWGKDTAERALTMQKAAASAPKEEYEMHPLWGRIKKSRR